MAAKKEITRGKIIESATAFIRQNGAAALNARSLAAFIGCSTRPIYLSFSGMAELKEAVREEITRIFQSYLERSVKSGKYPEYKAYGMGYINFAREEKKLFAYLFMRDRSGEEPTADGGDVTEVLNALKRGADLTDEGARLFHLESWIFVHGIAGMLATSYLDFDEEFASKLLTDMYLGLKMKFARDKGET